LGKRPCSGLAAGFGSVWVPSCGDNTLVRVDIKTNKVVATLPYGPANSEGGIAASADSVWMLTDKTGVLSRIDPATNQRTAEIQVPSGSYAAVLGEDGAIWISSTGNSLLTRVDAQTNAVTDRIAVGPESSLSHGRFRTRLAWRVRFFSVRAAIGGARPMDWLGCRTTARIPGWDHRPEPISDSATCGVPESGVASVGEGQMT
jgi:streptogramin lyase